MKQWIGGLLATVIGGVLIYWLTVGFPSWVGGKNNSNRYQDDLRQHSDIGRALPKVGIGACASGASPSNEFHDSPAANGSWDWNCDGQVEREWGTCEALSREQCIPNTNVTGARPGFCPELRGPQGCVPKIGECGQSGWVYPCFLSPADGRCHAGGVETATIMRCR